MKDPQNVECLVIQVVKELVGRVHVVCHCAKSISETRPELDLVWHPCYMTGKMTVHHPADPQFGFFFNIGEMAIIS